MDDENQDQSKNKVIPFDGSSVEMLDPANPSDSAIADNSNY